MAGLRLRRAMPLAVVLALSLAANGCAFSYKLGLSGKDDKAEATAGIGAPTAADQTADLPPEADLAYARAAVHEVLSRGNKYASQPWENPRSGARGTVTPIATAYTHDGLICRDFLASHVRAGNESWLQGEACRIRQGSWEVKRLRPY